MRVAIFTDTFLPTINGVSISIANLCEGFKVRGHYAKIFAPAYPGLERPDGVDTFDFPSFLPPLVPFDYPIALPVDSKKLTQEVRRGEFDLIHCHQPFRVGNWGLLEGKRCGLPVVTSAHTQCEIYARQLHIPAFFDWYLQGLIRKHCNAADLVTTPGLGQKLHLEKIGVETPIVEVSNPTKLETFYGADGTSVREAYGIKSGEILIGYVGRLSGEKNLGVLLDEFEQILRVVPTARLMIVGGGNPKFEKRLKARAYAISRDRIIFTGRIDHDQIAPYFAAMDVFVTPSMSEVQPMSFAEAFAAGTPIVAFNVPGCNDMVRHLLNGLLVDVSRQAGGLAEAVLLLLSDPLALTLMSERARESAHCYDQMVAVDCMLAAYKRARELYSSAA